MMLAFVLALGLGLVFLCPASAEEIQCLVGETECAGSLMMATYDGEVHCCPSQFSIHSLVDNCTCIRSYTEVDCSTDPAVCQNATINIGGHCCKAGQSMINAGTSIINGQLITGSCKCRTYVGLEGGLLGTIGSIIIGK